MARGKRKGRRKMPPADWVPRFNDPALQAVFEQVRPVLDDYKARKAWVDQTGTQPPAGAGREHG